MRFPPRFLDAFETAQREVFRLETRQHYAGDPNFDRFVAGEAWQDTPSKNQWRDLVRRRIDEQIVMRRVQLIRCPLSDYMRFRLEWSNTLNIEAGEDCRIAVEGPWDAPDFWLFDDTDAWLMSYDDDGELVGVEAADPEIVLQCREWKQQAIAFSRTSIPAPDVG